jgi:hypothetical protein
MRVTIEIAARELSPSGERGNAAASFVMACAQVGAYALAALLDVHRDPAAR